MVCAGHRSVALHVGSIGLYIVSEDLKPVGVVCTRCLSATSSTPAGWIGDDDDATTGYALIRCSHCRGLLVIQEHEDWDDAGKQLVPDGPPIVLWPGLDSPLSAEIPEPTRNTLEEARACHRAGAFTASALMVRRTLEAVCTDKGAAGRDLYAKLNSLKEMKVIEGNLADWSHDLRALGNDAAHGTSVVISADDARDALELAEAMLSYVYVLKARYEVFKSRRSNSGGPSPEPTDH